MRETTPGLAKHGEGRYTARCERFANSVKCRAKFAAEEKPKNQHDRRAGRPPSKVLAAAAPCCAIGERGVLLPFPRG